MSLPRLLRSFLPVLCLASLPLAAGGELTLPLTDSAIRLQGRAVAEGGALRLHYPGSEIVLRFKGASVAIRGESESGENWFNLEVDGQRQPGFSVGTGSFDHVLAEGLDPEREHTIRLVRRNEGWQGKLRLDAFVLPAEAEVLPPPELPERAILSIGDSITCGHGVEFIPPGAVAGHHNANAQGTYAWRLAERLGARLHLVSYGGKGLMRDWQGLTEPVRAIEFFERALPDEVDSAWDHERYRPDLVTICLGTNDYASGIIEPEAYATAYVELIDRILGVHPQARVLLISSPMLADQAAPGERAAGQVLREALARVVEHYRAEGRDAVRAAHIGRYAGTDWDAHPTAPQHARIADELEPAIRDWLGWQD